MSAKHYITSFCNFPHDVTNGKPIDHQCYTLPPAALAAEIKGDYDKANELLHSAALPAGPGTQRLRRR